MRQLAILSFFNQEKQRQRWGLRSQEQTWPRWARLVLQLQSSQLCLLRAFPTALTCRELQPLKWTLPPFKSNYSWTDCKLQNKELWISFSASLPSSPEHRGRTLKSPPKELLESVKWVNWGTGGLQGFGGTQGESSASGGVSQVPKGHCSPKFVPSVARTPRQPKLHTHRPQLPLPMDIRKLQLKNIHKWMCRGLFINLGTLQLCCIFWEELGAFLGSELHHFLTFRQCAPNSVAKC